MSRAERAAADSSGWNPAHDGQKSERSERFWPSVSGFPMLPGLKGTGQTLVHVLGKPVPFRLGLGPAIWVGVTEGNGAGNPVVIRRFYPYYYLYFLLRP